MRQCGSLLLTRQAFSATPRFLRYTRGAGRVSPRKLGIMLDVLHVREKSAARAAAPRSGETALVTHTVKLTSDIVLQPEERLEDAGLEEDSTPLPSTFTEEEREINVPLLGEHVKTLAKVPSLFNPRLRDALERHHLASPAAATKAQAEDAAKAALAMAEVETDIGTVLEGRNLSQLTLTGADLSSSFNRANLRYTSFDVCRIWHSTFDQADMRRVSMQGAEIRNTTFVATDLQSANLSGARFTECRFIRCNLRRSTLHSTIFHRCEFTLSDLSDSCVNPHTAFFHPEGWGTCRRLRWVSPAHDAPPPRVTLPENATEQDKTALPASGLRGIRKQALPSSLGARVGDEGTTSI